MEDHLVISAGGFNRDQLLPDIGEDALGRLQLLRAPAPEPQPPAPPAPPIESLGYSLKGVVSDGASRWAIVSHPTGEALLKVGDPLGEAYTVTAIDVQGLWGVSSPGAEPQLLGFAK